MKPLQVSALLFMLPLIVSLSLLKPLYVMQLGAILFTSLIVHSTDEISLWNTVDKSLIYSWIALNAYTMSDIDMKHPFAVMSFVLAFLMLSIGVSGQWKTCTSSHAQMHFTGALGTMFLLLADSQHAD